MKTTTLQDRLKNNAPYFRGMEVINDTLIIKVQYQPKWGVFPSEDETIKVAKSEEVPNEYFYYADYMTVTIDSVFDLIESTINMNLSAAAKIELLNEKFEELKQLFASESLERLQTLTFTMKEPKKRANKKKIAKETLIVEPQVEEISEEVREVETCA
jgi:hypothetical protein